MFENKDGSNELRSIIWKYLGQWCQKKCQSNCWSREEVSINRLKESNYVTRCQHVKVILFTMNVCKWAVVHLILWVQQFFFSSNLLSLIVSFCGNSSPGKNPHMVKFCRASCRFWKTSTYSVYFADSYNKGTFVQASNICLSFCAYKITLFFIILLQIRSRCAKNGFPQPIICQIYNSSLHNCPIFCED